MWQMTKRTDDTSTEAAGTTEMTTTATGVNGDATATRTKRGDHTDIAHTAIERDHVLAHDHHTNALTTETVMSIATDLAATEIVVHLAHVPLADVVRMTITRSAASPILVQNDLDLPDQNPDHRTGPGETTTADNKDDAHLPMSVLTTDSQSRIARHQGRRNVTRQQSKQSARSGWRRCSRMLRNWKLIVERDLRILMREMRSSGRRMIARGPIRPTSLVAYGRKPKVSTLGGGCKVDEAVVMKIEDSDMIFPLEEHPLGTHVCT
jgi:hypothetical protein